MYGDDFSGLNFPGVEGRLSMWEIVVFSCDIGCPPKTLIFIVFALFRGGELGFWGRKFFLDLGGVWLERK